MGVTVALHKQFWGELKEEKPDLLKLKNSGSRISKEVHAT